MALAWECKRTALFAFSRVRGKRLAGGDSGWHSRTPTMNSLIPISVRKDHLEQLAHATRPVDALAELIWNAFDADAVTVRVECEQNVLGGIEAITISDDGKGIVPEHAAALFGNLGESWKRGKRLSDGGRQLHGRKGRGRFKAFGLGSRSEWTSFSLSGAGVSGLRISGDIGAMDGFRVEAVPAGVGARLGTRVRITALHRDCGSLLGERGRLQLSQLFGPFLEAWPGAQLWLDNERVHPSLAQVRSEDSSISISTPEGVGHQLAVRIIEWSVDADRHIHLCGSAGHVRQSLRAGSGIRAKNCSFTAYVRGSLVDVLAGDGRLGMEELDPLVAVIADEARNVIRAFLQSREEGKAGETVARWRQEGIHPFPVDDAADMSKARTRELFEQAALQVTRRWAGIGEAGSAERKLLLSLVANVAETRPSELAKLLDDSLGLDKRGRERLQRLASQA